MLRLASLYVMADALFLVFGGALRGAGDTFWAMCISVTFHWVLVAVLFTLLRIFSVSAFAAWFMLCIIFMMFSCVIYLRYRSGKWRSLRVVEPEVETTLPDADGFHEPVNS